MKNQIIHWIAIAVITMVLAACGSLQGGSAGDDSASGAKGEFDKLYGKAEKSLKKLADAGGAWVNTEDTLKQARDLASKQNYDKAMKLVKEAMAETDIAQQQFESQRNARPYLF